MRPPATCELSLGRPFEVDRPQSRMAPKHLRRLSESPQAMSETYARMMSVDIRRISVALRELGDGGVWRCVEAGGAPVPVSVMMLDIRPGRPPELRMEVAKTLCRHCVDILGLEENRLNVEFTQHSGDEMYHPSLGGYSPEWQAGEA